MNIFCWQCNHYCAIYEEGEVKPWCTHREAEIDEAEQVLARNVPAGALGFCDSLSYDPPLVEILEMRSSDMRCYYCEDVCSVLYPTTIKVEVLEQKQENCRVFMLYEILACRDCLRDKDEVVLGVDCPYCGWPLNLWHDHKYRCPRCCQEVEHPLSPLNVRPDDECHLGHA